MDRKHFINSFLIISTLFISLNVYCQIDEIKVAPEQIAQEKLNNGNYEDALEDYLSLLKQYPNNEIYNYNVAVCYLNSNINKTKAIPYLERITGTVKYDYNAKYLLGRAYHFAYRFDDAIIAYTAFKTEGKGTADNLKNVERQIQYCINAKELMRFPLSVTFENLGKNINSPYADYFPFVPIDESFIVFNTKRPEGIALKGNDGNYESAIYISKVNNGSFSKSKNIGSPLSDFEGNKEVIGLSSRGDIILLCYGKTANSGDLYMATADENKNFKKAIAFDENINSKGQKIAAAISPDGNDLYFVSNRAGGQGGTDIYISHKLPNGTWGLPMNMGSSINTDMDEDFPTISPDGKTLYFSSNGHTSMGGYDIFKTNYIPETQAWESVKNIGYPINTPEDNMNFRVSESGRYGYIAALKEGGLGDLDIYRVTFNEVETEYSIIKGLIASSDTTKKLIYENNSVTLKLNSNNDQQLYGNYHPNPITGKYVIIASPGVYTIHITAPGFQPLVEKIIVLDKSSFQTEMDKNFILLPEKGAKGVEQPAK